MSNESQKGRGTALVRSDQSPHSVTANSVTAQSGAEQSVSAAAAAHGRHQATAPVHVTTGIDAQVPKAAGITSISHPKDGTIAASGEILDRLFHTQIARVTGGISPGALAEAYFDWLMHLAAAPGRQSALAERGVGNAMKIWQYLWQCSMHGMAEDTLCVAPAPHDDRFLSEAWHAFPFNAIHQSFLMTEQWWHAATTGVRGVSDHHARVMEFATRQVLDVFSPSNFLWTNPDVLKRTQETSGQNLLRGFENFVDDWQRSLRGAPPAGVEAFQVGHDVAATPGKVVYRNRLIELIQYEPTTANVHPEPILIVPAWIMKYYILDLSPKNSMVRFLLDRGFTVFMISWKNPDAEDRDLGFDDYVRLGIDSALEAIRSVVGETPVHAAGYCLGGTLLSMAAAAYSHREERPFASLTFLAAQTDFTEAGELTLFTSESQVAFLEDMMWVQGYLDSKHMAGAFQMLRSSDLIWSRMIRDYLMGERRPVNDMMAWNADATRMPYRMHSEYLRRLFLLNDLAEGRFKVADETVALNDIHAPTFIVGTETDHVAPWRSVFKLNLLIDAEVTSVLTSGGHNAGIVSEPGHRHRHYRIATKARGAPFVDPDRWAEQVPVEDGSWWLAWADWLSQRSGAPQPPPRMGSGNGALLQHAPGSYVLKE